MSQPEEIRAEEVSDLPLAGVRVVDLGQIYAVPYCTLQLAYLGAEVIKVEPPALGEYLRMPYLRGGVGYAFLLLNANKRSITLNLKEPRGREILLRLLEDADVLLENYLTGTMEKLGLGYQDLASRFPRLIYASAKGYGADSRWAKLGAMDYTVQAACGMVSVTGYPDRPGVRTPATFIDMGTGSHLLSGILAALIQRGRTGRGQKVEVAMHDICIPAMTRNLAIVLDGGSGARLANRHPGLSPCNNYPAKDGEVAIFCLTEPHWRDLIDLMGRIELGDEPRFRTGNLRSRVADEIDAIVSRWTAGFERDELVRILLEREIPCAPVRTVDEVVADPDVARRGMLRDSEFPTRGSIKVLGMPIKLSQVADRRPIKRPPALGEQTDEVLGQIGITKSQLESLRRDGII